MTRRKTSISFLIIVLSSAATGAAQDHADQGKAKGTAHADHMDRHFDNAEDWAKVFDDPARDAWQMPDRVIRALKLKPGQAVADIGSGTGYFSIRMAKTDPSLRVYGVDIEPSMVEYLRYRAAKEGLSNVTAVKAGPDSANLPAKVDMVLIVDTYHHIPGRVAYFRKLSGSMKPGGRLAIVDFKPDAPMGPPKEFRLTPDQMRSELQQAGFRQVEDHDFLPNQQFLIFAER